MFDGLAPNAFAVPANWPDHISFVFEQADLIVSTITLSSKVKPENYAWLEQAAREVNAVWNHCNATSWKAWSNRYGGKAKWLSAFDMNDLLAGCGEVFDKIGIDIAQSVSTEHAVRRNQFSKCKLKFRKSGGSRKSLGWIPFKAPNLRFSVLNSKGKKVTLKEDPQPVVPAWPAKREGESKEDYKLRRKEFQDIREQSQRELDAWEYRRVKEAAKIKVSFMGKTMRLFNAHRLLDAFRLAKQGVGCLRAGNFAQDSLGDWYLNVVVDKVEAQLAPLRGGNSSIGLDPGQIETFTASDGSKLRSRRYRDSEDKIKLAQKRAHQQQAKYLHRKVRRQRKDDQQKFARNLVNNYNRIWIGNLLPQKLAKSKLKGQAKSIYDAAIGLATNTLQAMGHRAGRVVEKVNERNSTRRCSNCQSLTGPIGLDNCVVRRWVCSACGTHHERDPNSARNIEIVGETDWNTGFLKNHVKTVAPRYWRPFAGTR